MRTLAKITTLVSSLLLLSSCAFDFRNSFYSDFYDDNSRPQFPPLASAGADQLVPPYAWVTLDGNGSYHPGGDLFKMRWRQIINGDEPTVILSSTASPNPSFLAPKNDCTLFFELEACDGLYCTYDMAKVIVQQGADPQVGPVVLADGDYLSFGWLDINNDILLPADNNYFSRVLVSRPGFRGGYESEDDIFFDQNLGIEIWALYGNNGKLESAPDFIVLAQSHYLDDYENDSSYYPEITKINGPSYVLPGAKVELDAELDFPFTVIPWQTFSFRWQQLSGPHVNRDDLGGYTAFQAPMEATTLTFALSYSDGLLESAPFPFEVKVGPSPDNHAPQAVIEEQLYGHIGRIIELDGMNSVDIDGDSLTFFWQKLAGPQISDIVDNNGSKMGFVAPEIPGELAFMMQVCDAEICAASRTIMVNVLPFEQNTAPRSVGERAFDLSSGDLENIRLVFKDREQDDIAVASCQFTGELEPLNCILPEDSGSDDEKGSLEQPQRDANSDDGYSDGDPDGTDDGNSDLPAPAVPNQHVFVLDLPVCYPEGWSVPVSGGVSGGISCLVCDDLAACSQIEYRVNLQR